MSKDKLVAAGDVKPGRRYLTARGVLLQAGRGPDGKLELVKNQNGDHVGFYMVVDNKVQTKRHLVPLGYHGLSPAFERRRGRPALDDRTWRGWAQRFPGLPNRILMSAKSAGLYQVEHANYITLGRSGQNHFALFRSGFLGVKDPEMLKLAREAGFKLENRDGGFFQKRINLADVMMNGRELEFMTLLTTFMTMLR